MKKTAYDYQALLFVLPLLVMIAVFMVYPALTTFYYGFTKWNGISAPQWQGLANFGRLVADSSFHAAVRNALILALYVPIWTILPLLVAASIRKPVAGSGLFRGLSLIPFVISPVILGVLFNVLLRTNGAVNTLLHSLGLGFLAAEWLVESKLVIHVVALVTIFKFFGFGVILYLGAMAKISESLYDAAKIDGCGWLQTLSAVTVPGIRHTIEFFVVLGFVTFFARMFPIIYTMTGGGPGYASFVPEFGIYFQAFQNFQLGYSATWAIFVYLLTFAIIFAQVMLMRRGEAQ
jgi:ABC-type sugar transport system permease subunit